jgi:hypothetical protein
VSTPTALQTIRAGANRLSNEKGNGAAALVLVEEAVRRVGLGYVVQLATGGLMGAKDVATYLGVKAPNLGKEKGLRVAERISDGRPVYYRREVERVAEARRKRST